MSTFKHQRGFPIKTENVERDNILNVVGDANLKHELRSRQHFLVDSELRRARHKIFNYAVENLNETVAPRNLINFSTL